jgi:hypothetical protein
MAQPSRRQAREQDGERPVESASGPDPEVRPALGQLIWVPVSRDRRVAGQAAGGAGGVVGVDGGAVFGIAWYSFQAP